MAKFRKACWLCVSEHHQRIRENRRQTYYTEPLCRHEEAKPFADVIDRTFPDCASMREDAMTEHGFGPDCSYYQRDQEKTLP